MSDKIVNQYCGTKQVAGCICSEGRIEGEVTHIVRKCHGSLEKNMGWQMWIIIGRLCMWQTASAMEWQRGETLSRRKWHGSLENIMLHLKENWVTKLRTSIVGLCRWHAAYAVKEGLKVRWYILWESAMFHLKRTWIDKCEALLWDYAGGRLHLHLRKKWKRGDSLRGRKCHGSLEKDMYWQMWPIIVRLCRRQAASAMKGRVTEGRHRVEESDLAHSCELLFWDYER
jgi:hypothetical protein